MPISKLRPTFTFTEDRLRDLEAVVPEVFADGRINWDTLKDALSEHLEEEGRDAEHFGLFWPGKRDARRLAALPSQGTLVPVPGEGVNEDDTHNVFIEGDNLEVLKLLQKSYAGRVKMIYIDPPYNTGNDFVYKDDYSEPLEDYLRKTAQADEAGRLLTTNTKATGRFHSNWLGMMYPRLRLARSLLSDDGVIFVSIDDNEAHNLRQMMNEIFGEENFVTQMVWLNQEGGGGSDSRLFRIKHEYVLAYARDSVNLQTIGLDVSNIDRYRERDDHFDSRGPYYLQKLNQASIQYSASLDYEIIAPDGKPLWPRQGSKRACWRWSKGKLQWGIENDFIVFKKDRQDEWQVYTKQYLRVDNEGNPIKRTNPPTGIISDYSTIQASKSLFELFGISVFEYSKPSGLIKYLSKIVTQGGEVVVDFFAGSCTTAQAVLEHNREDGGRRVFIMVQLPEPTTDDSTARNAGYATIAEIGKERIRRVIAKMQSEGKSQLALQERETPEDLGFKVFKLARSNYKAWQDYQGDDITQVETLFDRFETPLVDDWDPEKLLTEIMLMEGFPLDSDILVWDLPEPETVFSIESDACPYTLNICFDPVVDAEIVEKIDLQPGDVFVCLDSALTDQAKARLSDACNLKII